MRPVCGGAAASLGRSIPPDMRPASWPKTCWPVAARSFGAAELAARYHHRHRRTLRRGAVMPADGFGFAFGLSARPTLEAAARAAITEMCQIELADAVIATKRSERGDAALNAQDRTHLRRADDQCRSMLAVAAGAGPASHLAIDATEASVIYS